MTQTVHYRHPPSAVGSGDPEILDVPVMPMFQVDHGRAVLVQPGRPSAAAFAATRAALAGHLEELLGEQLLPVRVRAGERDEPYLLALDASGHPVVVEVTALLDEAAVVRALRHAGRVARLSLRDVAALHPAGAERLLEDLARFRETVPFAALGRPAGAVRLLLVCSEVGPGMAEVVEALTAAGHGVDVLRVGTVDGATDGPVVDISPMRSGVRRRGPPPAAERSRRVGARRMRRRRPGGSR